MSHGGASDSSARIQLAGNRVEIDERPSKPVETQSDFGSAGAIAEDRDEKLRALAARVAELEAHNRRLQARLTRLADPESGKVDSEERYRTILNSEPACVKITAEDGTLLSMNPAGLAMIEADSEDQVVGLCVFDLVLPDDRAAYIDRLERTFRGESGSLEFGIEGLKGGRLQMESFSAPLTGDDGRIVAQLAVAHDITARKLEQQELHSYREHLESLVAERTRELEASREEARRVERLASLGTLAAGLAHELNNPLGTILLGTEMIRIAEDRESLEAAIAKIQQDVERCNHIVKSMLRFGRDETSNKFPVSLNQVIRTAREHSSEILEKRDISLELDLTPDLPLLMGNATELGQVLINLIQNAVIASERSSRIQIRTRRDTAHILCEVEDSGCGMTPEVTARARDPFFTTHLAQGGTGLGLSVSHGIVTEHHGTLEIESELDRRTVVTLSLPVLESAPQGR